MKKQISKEILEELNKNGWNISATARLFRMSRSSLSERLANEGYHPPEVVLPTPIAQDQSVSSGDPICKEEFQKGSVNKGEKKRVLAIGDPHEPFAHAKYLDFVRQVYDEFGCDTVVFIGDVGDNHATSYHEHNPNGLSAGQELAKLQKKLKRWAEIFPTAYVCIGNHDEILFRKAVTHGLPNAAFKGLNEIYGTPDTWKWGLSWEIDNVLYQHGTGSSGENAHKTRALKNRQSTVIGHVHSHGGVSYMASDKDLIFGMNVGCGIDIKSYAMLYGRDFANRPTLGCGVVLSGKHAFFIPMDLGTRIRWA